jgi:stage II sporulation protein R
MKYKTKIFIVLILIIIAMTTIYAVESYYEIVQLETKIIRLHIIANSDTLQDQELKLKVRNNILNNFNKRFSNITSKKDSEALILRNLNEIREIAQRTVYEEGYFYNVEVYYGNYKFPIREYDNFTLPSGDYDAVRVEIGEAKGQNWWCVMFPPLCFTDFGKKLDEGFENIEEKLKEVLTEQEIQLIKTNRGYSQIKFKSIIAELIQGFVKNEK